MLGVWGFEVGVRRFGGSPLGASLTFQMFLVEEGGRGSLDAVSIGIHDHDNDNDNAQNPEQINLNMLRIQYFVL